MIEQLKIEKQHLVANLVDVLGKSDEDQRKMEVENRLLSSEFAALKAQCDLYVKSEHLIEEGIVEVFIPPLSLSLLPKPLT